ncbi:MAG: MBL fold metallo-hydrolase [Chitinophagaceae bacterium]|nr:MBL fold metallo-hydrolase [Chitinophagaceae bacterium]
MSLFITSLNSGSNGNCYYIGNKKEAVLIDAGLSCREVEKRMHSLDLPVTNVKAIFISHEHTDHVKGLPGIASKYKLPVYITGKTLQKGGFVLRDTVTLPLGANEPVAIGDLVVTAFPKNHDAVDPHSFIISGEGITIGVFTDIGIPCEHVIYHFKQCNAAFLEANYDEVLLQQGKYPFQLKQRIRGGKGHLSNKQALDLFITHRPSFMSHLLLSHLSRENNCPDLLMQLFTPHATDTSISIASRFGASPVYTVYKGENGVIKTIPAPRLLQGVLF